MKSILPNGIVVYTVKPIDSGEVIDDVEGEDDDISIVIVLIVIIVSVVVVISISVLVYNAKCISNKKTASIDFKSYQMYKVRDQDFWDFHNNKVHRRLLRNFNVHTDEDLFKFLPFDSAQEHVTTSPNIQKHTPRILDYSMI